MSEELIYINGSYQRPNSVKKEVNKAVKELVGLAPEEFDTMQELAEAVQENTEALKNVKIEAEAPLVFKNGKIQLNYSSSLSLNTNNYLDLNPTDIYQERIGGVKIGTGYISGFPSFYYKNRSKSILFSGIHGSDNGIIGLLPPNIEGRNNQSTLGGILSAKIHETTPDIKEVTSGNYYQIETDELGNAFVRVPESSGSVDIATDQKAGIVKLGTATIVSKSVPVSTDIYDKLALAIGPNLYNTDGVLNIKIASGLIPGVIKLGTGDTIRDTSGTKYGLNYSDSEGAYVTIPNNNSTGVENATVSNFGIVKLGMSSFDTSRKQPVGEGQFSTGTGLGFPIGTGLASTGNTLHVNIGTGLAINDQNLTVSLDDNLFTWSNNKISINIDNLKIRLGL